jgi:hypothetical protein
MFLLPRPKSPLVLQVARYTFFLEPAAATAASWGRARTVAASDRRSDVVSCIVSNSFQSQTYPVRICMMSRRKS